jgi:hypothetical protein
MADFPERVARGEVQFPCGVGIGLLPGLAGAALAVDGGPYADSDVPADVACCLHPGHRGLHYAVVRNLTAGAMWLRWRGLVCELVELDASLPGSVGGDRPDRA